MTHPFPLTGTSHEWAIIERSRWHSLWRDLPDLNVFAAIPGHGVSTLLSQARHFITTSHTDTMVHQITNRRALDTFLDRAHEGDHHIVFLEDVIHRAGDPLWHRLTQTLTEASNIRFVVTSLEPPGCSGQSAATGHLRLRCSTDQSTPSFRGADALSSSLQ